MKRRWVKRKRRAGWSEIIPDRAFKTTMKKRDPEEKKLTRNEKVVNSRVDFIFELYDIPDIEAAWEESHELRAIVINGKSPVLNELAAWKKTERADYKKILKVMERVARLDRVIDEKHVTADGARRGVYEMRAHKGHARVLFFYDEAPDFTVILTNCYWKGRGDQTKAFDLAVRMMELWKQAKPGK